MHRLAPVALAAILLLGAGLRTYNLTDNPHGFFADEASFGYNAYTILRHGTDEYGTRFPLLFRAFGDYKLPIHTYGLVPFVAVFGLTETAVRLASAAFGTATIAALYLLARVMFRSHLAGLLAALVLAVEPWHAHYSRTGFEFVSFPLFLVLGWALFFLGRERPRLWLIAAALLALTLYTYRAAWVFMPPFLIVLTLLYWPDLRRYWRVAVLSGLVILLLSLPLGWHLLLGPDDRIRHVPLLGLERGRAGSLLETYSSYFSASFLFQNGDGSAITRHYLPGHGQLYWFQAPFLLLGITAIGWRFNRAKALLLGALLLYPSGGILTDVNPISNRTIQGAVLYPLLTALGLLTTIALLERLRRSLRDLALSVFSVSLLLVGGLQVAGYLERYHNEYPRLSTGYLGWQWGASDIVRYFVRVQDDYDELVMDADFTQPQILLHFYAPDDCVKCRIGNGDDFDAQRRQIFALRPYNLRPAFRSRIEQTLSYASGETAFQIAEILGGTFTVGAFDLTSAPTSVPEATFNGELRVTGFAAVPGRSRVALRWEVLSPPAENYNISARAVDATGTVRAQDDFLLGDWQDRTKDWPTGATRYTVHDLHLPSGAPAGQYSLVVVVYVLGPPLRNMPVSGTGAPLEALPIGVLPDWQQER